MTETAPPSSGSPVRLPDTPIAAGFALALAGLGSGRSRLSGLPDDDTARDMTHALRALGCIVRCENADIHVDGAGIGCLLQPAVPLRFSSVLARTLMIGLVAPFAMEVSIEAVAGAHDTAPDPLLDPLRAIGVQAVQSPGDRTLRLSGRPVAAPLEWSGAAWGSRPEDDCPTAAFLLAALNAAGTSSIACPGSVEIWARPLLARAGAFVVWEEAGEGWLARVGGQRDLAPFDVDLSPAP